MAAEADARSGVELDMPRSELVRVVEPSELNVRAELGVGLMLSSYQRETLGYHELGQATGRVALNLTRIVSAQLSFGSVYLPSDERGDGQIFTAMPGIRFDWPVATLGRAFLDGNFGLVETVSRPRAGVDLGAGFELPVADYLELGPFARYHRVFAATPDHPSDASFFSVGVSASLRRLGIERPPPEKPRDADRDGVLDEHDRCPKTPSEPHPDPARPGCPARDSDRDRVVDPEDLCVALAAGPHPDPLRRGCPTPDRDVDTIVDALDACPDVRGVRSSDPTRHGCPPLVQIEHDRLRTLEPVYFATNEDRILPESEALLRDIAEALRKTPAVEVSIEGHTDDTGDDAHNLELSGRRAESVKRELVRLGIDPGRLEARGFGRTRPLENSTTPEAREKNRRVEFRILRPAPEKPR